MAEKQSTLGLCLLCPVQLAATGGVCHSEGYSRGAEQMGRSLLRVGAMPNQTNWEVDEGKEGETTVIGALNQGDSKDCGTIYFAFIEFQFYKIEKTDQILPMWRLSLA